MTRNTENQMGAEGRGTGRWATHKTTMERTRTGNPGLQRGRLPIDGSCGVKAERRAVKSAASKHATRKG